MTPHYAHAFNDIRDGIGDWRMWGRLGWAEVRRRYRRTVIGPFWASLSLAIFVVAIGVVWAGLWKLSVREYLPFLCAGLLAWTLVSVIITESCASFTAQEGLIRSMRVSYTLLTCSVVWRNLIVFIHNLVVFVVVALATGVPVNAATLLVVPGLVLVGINGIWIGLLLGMICARYRDIQQLITGLLQIAMLVTPIFWTPSQIPGRYAYFVDANVLFHFVDIVRGPLLGQTPAALSYIVVVGLALVGYAVTFDLFSRFRRRLPYWL